MEIITGLIILTVWSILQSSIIFYLFIVNLGMIKALNDQIRKMDGTDKMVDFLYYVICVTNKIKEPKMDKLMIDYHAEMVEKSGLLETVGTMSMNNRGTSAEYVKFEAEPKKDLD